MTDIASLAIEINTSDVKRAQDDLDALGKTGKSAEDSAKGVGSAWKAALGSAATDIGKMLRELQVMNARQDAMARSIAGFSASFDRAANSMESLSSASHKQSSALEQAASKLQVMEVSVSAAGDSSKAAAEKMASMAPAAISAEKAIDKLSSAGKKVEKATSGMAASAKADLGAAATTWKQFVAERMSDYMKLEGGHAGAMKRMGAEWKEYKKTISSGTPAVPNIKPPLDDNTEAMKRAGLSAKQYSQAMRMLPMQLTDVVTSLASGMPAWQVAIQQGGQVRDSFGGIGNAARAVVSSISPVAGAFTIAAAAVGTLLAAYLQAQGEAQKYNQALIMTGNAAGTSADQLGDMARRIDAISGTQRQAAAVLAQVAGTGKFAANQIESIGTAAILMQEATGKSVEATIADLVKLADEPSKASAKMNEQYHYLTASVYAQITALEEEGKTTEAAKLATDAYTTAMQQRAEQITGNLGLLERAWKAMGSAASEAWDSVLDIDRVQTLDQQIERTQKLLDDRKNGWLAKLFPDSLGANSADTKVLQDRLDLLQQTKAKNDEIAAAKGKQAEIDATAIKAQDQLNKDLEKSASNAEKLKKRYEEIDKLVADAVAGGKSFSAAQIQQLRDAAAKQFADPKQLKQKAYQDDAATRMLQSLREQQASLVTQLSTTQKLTASEQELAKFSQLVADLKGKSILTAEQKSLLANQDQIRAQLQKNVALEQELKQREEITRQTQLQSALDEQLANRRNAVSISVAGVGMGDRARQDMEQINAIQQGYARQLTSLAAAQGTANGLSEADYQVTVRNLRAAMDEEVAIYQDGAQQKLGAEQDWTKGATRAIENYRDNAQNIAGQVDGLFTNAFSSMEDAVAQFATTGKLSFSDFAKSVLADMARIEARRAASSLLSGIGSLAVSAVGSFFGGGSSAGSSAGDYTGAAMKNWVAAQAKGGGWSGGVQFFAKGGAFSNSVVTTPTAFGTASGLGVMGEAGPEAIMPLTRGRDGSLGVRASGGGATSLVINAPVTVQAQPGMGSQDAARQGAQIGQAMTAEVRKQISAELRNGGLIWRAMNGRS